MRALNFSVNTARPLPSLERKGCHRIRGGTPCLFSPSALAVQVVHLRGGVAGAGRRPGRDGLLDGGQVLLA